MTGQCDPEKVAFDFYSRYPEYFVRYRARSLFLGNRFAFPASISAESCGDGFFAQLKT